MPDQLSADDRSPTPTGSVETLISPRLTSTPGCRSPADLGQCRYDKGAAEHPPLPTRPAPRQGRTTLTIAVREILLRQNPFDPTSACPLSDYASKETEPMAGDWGSWLPSAGYGCSPCHAHNRR